MMSEQRERDKAAAEERKKQEAVAKRTAALAKFTGAVVAGVGSQDAAAPGAKKKSAKERKQMATDSIARAEQAKADVPAQDASALIFVRVWKGCFSQRTFGLTVTQFVFAFRQPSHLTLASPQDQELG